MIGFLNLQKPAGMTSHDCVAIVRRHLRLKRVGHGGTLDPLATGVLPIAIGPATRLLRFLPTAKTYRATIRFGIATATDDLEGEVIATEPVPQLSPDAVRAALAQFQGTIEQIPPRYSAIQVDGQRLYDLARRGQEMVVPSRRVEVTALRWLHWQPGDYPEVILDIDCGPGTYIRAIARDLGAAVGTAATLARLERLRSCGMDLGNAIAIETMQAISTPEDVPLLPPTAGLAHLPSVHLRSDEVILWGNGRPMELPRDRIQLPTAVDAIANPEVADAVCVLSDRDGFLGIGRQRAINHQNDQGDNTDEHHDRWQLAPQVVLPPSP